MKALYLSALSSGQLIEELYHRNKKDPGFAVQKFNRLLVNGLVKNEVIVTVLSVPPIGRHNSTRIVWHRFKETEGAITYNYLNFINIPVFRQLCVFIGTIFRTLTWVLGEKKQNRVVVCDVLNASILAAAVLTCKITGTQIVGIMTDMPGLMVRFDQKQGIPLSTRMSTKLLKCCLANLDKYVFLTDAMNVVNKHNRPFIVMEGLCDDKMSEVVRKPEQTNIKTIMYAGGLHERYGLKKLAEAFMRLPNANYRLLIFGSGPFAKDLTEYYCRKDSRIEYKGVIPNSEVIKAEIEASVLVNPRPTTEDFTKYSFPSKNMEYMASGTPLLTTKLPGIPVEYYPYIYLIEDESIEGYFRAIESTLSQSEESLISFGAKAKEFVLKQKNNYEQAKRVIQLIKL